MITKFYTKLFFQNGDLKFDKIVVTEHPQSVEAMLHMLYLCTPDTSENQLKAWYRYFEPLEPMDAQAEYNARTYVMRRRCKYGDFFVQPDEQSTEHIMLTIVDDVSLMPETVFLYAPCTLINETCSQLAVLLVLRDIAAEATGRHPDYVTWSDFTEASPQLLAKYNIRVEKPEPIMTIKGNKHSQIKSEHLNTQTIFITKEQDVYIQKALHSNMMKVDETFSVTARFADGCQMDIKCCGGGEDDCAWTEAVLFLPNGQEIKHSDVDEEFDGVWELQANGKTYTTNVYVKE